jgi:hypothetical protein
VKRRVERWIRVLIALNVVIVAALAAVIAFDLLRATAGGGAEPAPPATSPLSATASPGLMEMGVAHIPTSNACVLCHGAGGEVKVVPAVLHPLEGWRRCIVCHTDETIGRKAPGHEGIAEEECLNCHKVAQGGPAITQPHAKLQDQRCLTCHGDVAHLPSSMASSKEEDCILCHKPTELPPPEYPHVDDPRLTCSTCHRSAEAGGLPIDHALRSDSTCLLCHELKIASGPGPSLPLPSGGRSPAPSAPSS